MRSASRTLIPILLSVGVPCALAGCPAPAATGAHDAASGSVATSVFKNVSVDLGGQPFVLKAADGSAIGNLVIVADGHTYRTQDGSFHLPASLLRDVRDRGNGFFRVFAPGFVPKQVWIGQKTPDVLLVPLFSAGQPEPLPAGGGTARSADGTIAVRIPPGALAAPQTPVAISSYQPQISADDQKAYQAAKGALLARLGKGRAAFHTLAACPPLPDQVTQSLGLLVSVGGPLAAGKLAITYDLAPLLRGWNGQSPAPWETDPGAWSQVDRARAQAAATLLANYQGLVDCYGRANTDAALAADDVVVSDSRLSFSVQIPPDRALDGYVQSTVQSLYDLGVMVQVTVVNATAVDLPPGTLPPDTIGLSTGGLVSQNGTLVADGGYTWQGATLISDLGSGVISNNGSGVISNNGGGVINGAGSGIISDNGSGVINGTGSGLVSNNGGSITGDVRVPFPPDVAKYTLLSWLEWLWPGATVQATDVTGTPWGTPATTNAAGVYTLPPLPPTPNVLVLETKAGAYGLRALAPAPGHRALFVGVNAATTGVASWVAKEFRAGAVAPADLDFSNAGYPSDIAYVNQSWGQNGARYAVTNPLDAVADATADWFRLNGHEPAVFRHWVATFAGNGAAGYANGSFGAAQFSQPTAIAFDPAGNLYVADYGNHCLRKVTPAGVVSLFAGQPGQPGSTDGPALGGARFTNPQSMDFDPAGNMYVADYGNHTIRKIDTLGNVTTIAGQAGVTGSADGTGAAASFWYPIGLIWHPSGVLYVSDRNDLVRRVTPAGVVTTIAGQAGVHALADGAGTAAHFNGVNDFALAPNGDMFVADSNNNCIRRVTTAGVVTTAAGTGVAGGQDGPAPTATFDLPTGIARGADGTLYVAEFYGNRIRVIDPQGQVRVLAGSAAGTRGFKDDLPLAARFYGARDVAIDPTGRLFASDRDNHAIRHIRP